MKLYLSSYHIGDHGQDLIRLAGHAQKALVVNNALDFVPDDDRRQIRDGIEELEELGFEPEELDLREYLGRTDALHAVLSHCRLVWLRGGNSFILRRAMKASGFDVAARPLIEANELVYGGYSAGAVVATPTLRGIELVDYPDVVPTGYDPTIPWDGMGLVAYSIAPHYRSNHPESAAVEMVVEYFETHHMDYRTLRDGEVIIVE
jgi:dipeptidase E